MTIYFDMDGTIADLYGVSDWLPRLRAEDATPYTEAEPMVDIEEFQLTIKLLQSRGVKFGIISWTSKGGSETYNKKVTKAKKEWLSATFPKIQFDETHFVKYGTRKDYVAKEKYGVLFDDDDGVRENWRGFSINPNTADILEILSHLKDLSE